MNLGELRSYTRTSVLKDSAARGEWSDADLDQWLNDAQRIFARRTFCFLDSESSITTFDTVDGTNEYTLDPLVLQVFAVHNGATELRKLPAQFAANNATQGTPLYWRRRGVSKLNLYPIPDDAYTLNMLVARLPLEVMQVDSDEPEIPEQHRLALCDWAAYQAMRNVDTLAIDELRKIMVDFRKDWEHALVEARREFYQQQRGM